MYDDAGNVRVKMGVSETGDGRISFYEGVAKSIAVASQKIQIDKGGISIFGATVADTVLRLFPDGDISSVGQIAVGIGATGADQSTVFGFNNTASGDSSVVSGGYDNVASGDVAVIGGGRNNLASANEATIGGGFDNTASGPQCTIAGGENNTATSTRSAIGGGFNNRATANYGTISGGQDNSASDSYTTVGGGLFNVASALWSTVGGGRSDTASASYATIGGGGDNKASGSYATVPGGSLNVASGNYSFAAGRQAQAIHNGAFVWADNNAIDFPSTALDQFRVRASGGTQIYSNSALTTGVTLAAGGGAWAAVSDRSVKENIRPVDGAELLDKLAQLDVSRWNYITQDPSIQHIGPMAQDFYRLFGVGDNNTTITTIDPAGIALAAIQELHKTNQELRGQIAELQKLMATLIAER